MLIMIRLIFSQITFIYVEKICFPLLPCNFLPSSELRLTMNLRLLLLVVGSLTTSLATFMGDMSTMQGMVEDGINSMRDNILDLMIFSDNCNSARDCGPPHLYTCQRIEMGLKRCVYEGNLARKRRRQGQFVRRQGQGPTQPAILRRNQNNRDYYLRELLK